MVVSDPENDEMDCEELGYAQVDLNVVSYNTVCPSLLARSFLLSFVMQGRKSVLGRVHNLWVYNSIVLTW